MTNFISNTTEEANMVKGKQQRNRAENFTLVELLVVISVIAVLAGLLLPALNSAREKGHTAVCAGNMKQVGITSSLYSLDYDGYPIPAYNGMMLLPFEDKTANAWWDTFYVRATGISRASTVEAKIKSYGSFQPLTCPSGRTAGQLFTGKWYSADNTTLIPITNYAYNSHMGWEQIKNGGPRKLQYTRYARIQRSTVYTEPSRRSVLIDYDGNNVFASVATAQPMDFITDLKIRRHNGKMGFNSLYLDGHVQYLNIGSLTPADVKSSFYFQHCP